MKRKVVLVSFTSLNSPGGVPRWNRDIKEGLEAAGHVVQHFSWDSITDKALLNCSHGVNEWDKAQILGAWLGWSKLVNQETVVLADGFWAAGLENFIPRERLVSVGHGNWSHTTKDDVENGIPPEFPQHHQFQLSFRRRHHASKGRLVAVSEFIAHQCKIQWDFDMPVINNGIDLEKFHPVKKMDRDRDVIVHGTTTTNKGFDHIDFVRENVDADLYLLDNVPERFKLSKYRSLAHADLFVHPSAHEGNSYMVLEALACGVPLISYDVGRLYSVHAGHDKGFDSKSFGSIIDRRERSPLRTNQAVVSVLDRDLEELSRNARKFAEMNSIQKFQREWVDYVESLG